MLSRVSLGKRRRLTSIVSAISPIFEALEVRRLWSASLKTEMAKNELAEASYATVAVPLQSSDSIEWNIQANSSLGSSAIEPQEPFICKTGDCGCPPAGNQSGPLAGPDGSTNGPGNPTSNPEYAGLANTPDYVSAAPVRYSNGVVLIAPVDLESFAFGSSWGHSRSWSNANAAGDITQNGNRWYVNQMAFLQLNPSGPIVFQSGSLDTRLFYADNSAPNRYVATTSTRDVLTYDSGADEYELKMTDGQVYRFYGRYQTDAPVGGIKTHTDARGVVTTTEYVPNPAVLGEFFIDTVSRQSVGGPLVETYSYEYLDVSDPNAGMLSKVSLSRNAGSGNENNSWVDYTYYEGSGDDDDAFGSLGDLKSATIHRNGQSGIVDRSYYRYYTEEDIEIDGEPGFIGGLKYVVSTDSYERMQAAGLNPTEISDTRLAQYADNYFEYVEFVTLDEVSEFRVSKEIAQGAGCTCAGSGGQGAYEFEYTENPSASRTNYNTWRYRTDETLPDLTVRTVFTNWAGQPLVEVLSDPADSTGATQSVDVWRYNGHGQIILAAGPTATEDVNLLASNPLGGDLLKDNGGPIYTYVWSDAVGSGESIPLATTSTVGYVPDRLRSINVQAGESGTPHVLQDFTYIQSPSLVGTYYAVAQQSVYLGLNSTEARTTTYTYEWYTGTSAIRSETVTLPVVSVASNGAGGSTGDQIVNVYNLFGQPVWSKDGDGFITYTHWDVATGGMLSHIQDADLSQTVFFDTAPTGWTTPAGGGLHLTTTYSLDNFGRVVVETDPAGRKNVTLYDDVADEVRTYFGWTGSAATGAYSVHRKQIVPVGSGSSATAVLYYEELTSHATPTSSGGLPTGNEDPTTALRSLSRSYTNNSGQIIRIDDYTNVVGLTYSDGLYWGSAGTNYQSTTYGYGKDGQVNRVVSPNGTITRTIYDYLGREQSIWIGTDDEPASQYWPASKVDTNLVKVKEFKYDDRGHLFREIQFLDSAATLSLARVTEYAYDDRDRVAGIKDGVKLDSSGNAIPGSESAADQRTLTTYEYDHLDRPIAIRQYDGDGLTLSTDVTAFKTANESLLRGLSTLKYDEVGRLFQTKVFGVHPTNGTYSETVYLESSTWYDAGGNISKTFAIGGLVTKYVYDGAGRNTITYFTDGLGDPASGATGGYAAALSVGDSDGSGGADSTDNVLEQVEYAYDGSGNLILTTTRQRFHNETIPGRLTDSDGSIPDVGGTYSGAKARVSYAAYFYDGVNRITDMVNVGTNGGSAYVRPPTAPTSSTAELLLTHYQYDIAGSSSTYNYTGLFGTEVIDPAGIRSRSYADLAGQTRWTIEAYNGSVQTASTNRRTSYEYDGSGHVVSMKVYTGQPGSPYQETTYTYGVSPAQSSSVFSNDLLYKVNYPGSGGTASPTNYEWFAYDVSGEKKNYVDRNNSVHSYVYDPVGRLFADRIGTVGAGVNSLVRALVYRYDSAGRLQYAETYSTSIVSKFTSDYRLSQVTRTYNGFGQVVSETSGTTVQYQYSTPGASLNASRLTRMSYDVTSIAYVYDAGVDNAISRLSGMEGNKYGGTGIVRLEGYAYLGLNTIVQRQNHELGSFTYSDTHGTTTTYAGMTLASLNGDINPSTGDIYTGLDTFGRIQDQRWIDAAGSSTDQFKYTYDLNSNPTSKKNELNAGLSEYYTYDALNRLQSFERGTLTFTGSSNPIPTGTTGTTRSQDWSLDSLGNWNSLTTSDGVAGPVVENRNHNEKNQLIGIDSESLDYDRNGNQIRDNEGRTLTYDAWNRLVSVIGDSSSTSWPDFQTWYSYDALGRRMTKSQDTYDDWSDELRGELDRDFGGDGIVNTTGTTNQVAGAFVEQADRKIVTAKLVNSNVVISRYTDWGTVDTTFGTAGSVTISAVGGFRPEMSLVMDGNRILFTGGKVGTSTVDGSTVIIALESDGDYDTTFGSGGIVTLSDLAPAGGFSRGQDLVIREDEEGNRSILVLSHVRNSSAGDTHPEVTALHLDGTIDTAYGDSGTYEPDNANLGAPSAFVLDQSGGVIIVGTTWNTTAGNNDGYAIRVKPNGCKDSNFGSSGIALFDGGGTDSFRDIADDRHGRFIIAGESHFTGGSDLAVLRLLPDGSWDSSFGTSGAVMVSIRDYDTGPILAIQGDGRIFIGGSVDDASTQPDIGVRRLNIDGSLDPTFGLPVYNVGGVNDLVVGAAVAANGLRLLIFGTVQYTGESNTNTALVAVELSRKGTVHYTHSTSWQLLSEAQIGIIYDYVWSAAYPDAMVNRDQVGDQYEPIERIYVRQDANWNVTSIVNVNGPAYSPTSETVERYVQDPYGDHLIMLSKDWVPESTGFIYSDWNWQQFHQGGMVDRDTGLMNFRFRDYDPEQGRWVQQDLASYSDGANLYQYINSSPLGSHDVYGLAGNDNKPLKIETQVDGKHTLYAEVFPDGTRELSIRDKNGKEVYRSNAQPGKPFVFQDTHGGKAVKIPEGERGNRLRQIGQGAEEAIDQHCAIPAGKQKAGALKKTLAALSLLGIIGAIAEAAQADPVAADPDKVFSQIQKFRNGTTDEISLKLAMMQYMGQLFKGMDSTSLDAAKLYLLHYDLNELKDQ